eukprot:2353518-Amphidinium_carterae.1
MAKIMDRGRDRFPAQVAVAILLVTILNILPMRVKAWGWWHTVFITFLASSGLAHRTRGITVDPFPLAV